MQKWSYHVRRKPENSKRKTRLCRKAKKLKDNGFNMTIIEVPCANYTRTRTINNKLWNVLKKPVIKYWVLEIKTLISVSIGNPSILHISYDTALDSFRQWSSKHRESYSTCHICRWTLQNESVPTYLLSWSSCQFFMECLLFLCLHWHFLHVLYLFNSAPPPIVQLYKNISNLFNNN